MTVRFVCSFCKREHNCKLNPECHWDPSEHDPGDPCYTFDPDHPDD